MPAFKNRTRQIEAQRWILKLVNNHCPELLTLNEGPRLEGRVNLTVAAWIVPIEGRMPLIAKAFTAVTREFSPSGLSLVINRPLCVDEVLVGFQWQEEKRFLRCAIRHVDPLGAGYLQLGVKVAELICAADFPELEALNF